MILTAKDKGALIRKIDRTDIDYPVVCDIETGDIRSAAANRRYWAAVVASIQNHLERETGQKHAKEAIHHMLKVERYGKKVDTIDGRVYERCARSSKMTPKQFAKYVDWSEAFAINELGVDPDEIDGLHKQSEYGGW